VSTPIFLKESGEEMKKWTFFIAMLVASQGAFAAPPKGSKAAGPTKVVVYKSPTCGCCGKWEDHLRASGFAVESKLTEAMNPKKAELGVPQELQSCHTAVVEGYVVEGHVPAASIKKLLKSMAKVKGIAVPGMPIGSPGMEGPNPEKYDVVSFGIDGKTTVFDRK
jgi:hypothetical protein